jgi:hypothetical protein
MQLVQRKEWKWKIEERCSHSRPSRRSHLEAKVAQYGQGRPEALVSVRHGVPSTDGKESYDGASVRRHGVKTEKRKAFGQGKEKEQ